MSRSSASPQPPMDPAEMRAEIERLTRELDKTSSEKIQSAQYGLVLLEEVRSTRNGFKFRDSHCIETTLLYRKSS